MTATIFDLQRFSVHDGPGIRTTVFMKGCPLRCAWCHNPEGLNGGLQTQFIKSDCIGCRRCGEKVYENAHLCPTAALKICGEIINEDTLFTRLIQDETFYNSYDDISQKGGVTFSGGECLLQADFVVNMLEKLNAHGIHTAIDTCGHVPIEALEKTKPFCNLYLYDIKLMDSKLHQQWTGVDNKLIIENLKTITTWDIPIWIRIPIVPDINDNISEIKAMADFLSTLSNIKQVTLMPYHTLGVSKYETLGLQCSYQTDKKISKAKLIELQSIFSDRSIPVNGG